MFIRSRAKRKRGFTLVELLVVMAIMGIILSIVAYSTISTQRGSALMVSASEVSTLTTLARSIAINKSTIARLCILKNNPNSPEDDYSIVSIWSYDRVASAAGSGQAVWVQETKWQRLSQGIVVDNYQVNGTTAPNGYDPANNLPIKNNIADPSYVPNPVIPNFTGKVTGSTITQQDCPFLEFDADGTLTDQSAGVIGFRIVEGHYSTTDPINPILVYTHKIPGTDNPANYAIIAVNNLTGRVQVSRN